MILYRCTKCIPTTTTHNLSSTSKFIRFTRVNFFQFSLSRGINFPRTYAIYKRERCLALLFQTILPLLAESKKFRNRERERDTWTLTGATVQLVPPSTIRANFPVSLLKNTRVFETGRRLYISKTAVPRMKFHRPLSRTSCKAKLFDRNCHAAHFSFPGGEE